MSYVAVANLDLVGSTRETGISLVNEHLIPWLEGQPGYQYSRFMATLDGKSATAAVVFDTQSNAEAGLEALVKAPSEAPAVVSTHLYELVAEG
jgi:hypothetical protein